MENQNIEFLKLQYRLPTLEELNYAKRKYQSILKTKPSRKKLSNYDTPQNPESYIILAERVAKITYNESGLSAPFDHNSGWFIPILSKRTAEFFKNDTLNDEILRILSLNVK